MKVLCIKKPDRPHPETVGNIEVGNIYTVIDTHLDVWYELEEPETNGEWYKIDLFAPLSNIDEMEIHNIKELQTV